MNDIVSPEHEAAARRFRALTAAYEANRDLVMMGAYRPGTDRTLDEAIALHPRMVAFLSQGTRDQVTLADAADQMQELIAHAA
jgi:flagellum-specific ATP synthase